MPLAYENWLDQRDSTRLMETVGSAERHWLAAARRLVALYRQDPLQGDAVIRELAGGDLTTLKR